MSDAPDYSHQFAEIARAQETLGYIEGLPTLAANRIAEIIDELSEIARAVKAGRQADEGVRHG